MPVDIKTLFKKEYIIGLDIGSSSIKLAQFVEREDGLRLVRAELKEIKQVDDEALKEQETISVIRSLFRGIDVKKSRIITCINCPQTAVRKITAPYMPRSELRDGIRLEAKNYFPFPIDESLLDFEILSDRIEKGVRKYEVEIAVCPIKTVDRYMSLLEKAGLKPSSVISSSYALQRMGERSGSKASETKCFIDIGELNTELTITKEKSLTFTRKIPITGSDFTKALTGTFVSDAGKVQLSTSEAERIKRDAGIPAEADSRMIDNKISTLQILSMFRSPVEQLASEINRCFDYYREEGGGERVDSVILFGGGASLGGLVKLLCEELEMEVKLGDSLDGINLEKDAVRERDKISHRLEMAINAALLGTKGINLLPPEMKDETKRVIRRGTIEVIGTTLILGMALIYIGMRIQLANFQKRISVAKVVLSSVQPQLKKIEAQRIANMVLINEPQWEDVFKELGNLIPDSVRMTSVKMENDSIIMKGIVASPQGLQALSDFILSLEKGLFDDVRLVESKELGANQGIEFELKCWIDYENTEH